MRSLTRSVSIIVPLCTKSSADFFTSASTDASDRLSRLLVPLPAIRRVVRALLCWTERRVPECYDLACFVDFVGRQTRSFSAQGSAPTYFLSPDERLFIASGIFCIKKHRDGIPDVSRNDRVPNERRD